MTKENQSYWKAKKGKDGSLRWEEYAPFDVDKAVQKLNPEQRGRDYANNFINSDQDPSTGQLTDIERELLKTANEHINGLQRWHIQAAGDIRKEINEKWNNSEAQSLDDITNKFKLEAGTIFENFKIDKQKLLSDHKKATLELRSFKQKHNLLDRHQAHYPESNIEFFAYLFVALLIEGIANAYFFPSDMGLLGGFVMAFVVSLANVFLCFTFGWILPNVNYDISRPENRLKGFSRKIGAGIVFLFSLVFIFGLHSSVAQYRENVMNSTNISTDIPSFIYTLSFDPRGLQDMESLVLIAIGLAISIFSYYKGYTFDDPYPGFGRAYRSWKKYEDLVSESDRDYKNKLVGEYRIAFDKVQKLPNAIDTLERQLKALESEISTYLACVKSYYDQACQGGLELLTKFRNTVQIIRNNRNCLPVDPNLVTHGLHQLDPKQMENSVMKDLQEKLNKLQMNREDYSAQKETTYNTLQSILDDWKNKNVIQIGSGIIVEEN